MRQTNRLLLMLSSLVVAQGISAQTNNMVLKGPNWDREIAVLTATLSDTQSETSRLFNLLQQSSADESLRALSQLANRSGWSAPAREAVLFQLTNQLRELPPFSIDGEVMAFLRDYQVQTLVSHEESRSHGIPLYPINAAAYGVTHQWTRQQARAEASELMRTGLVADVLEMYLVEDDYNVRAGIRDSLGAAPVTSLRALLNESLARLSAQPELTGLSGKAALQLTDTYALSQIMVQGEGHELVEITRQAKQSISAKGLGNILLASLDDAPASTSAMVIAELAAQTIDQQRVSDALMLKLDHRDLGSTAALALVRWGTAQQREALRDRVSVDASSLAAKRIQTAMSVNQNNQNRN